jgi:hypothetical protein
MFKIILNKYRKRRKNMNRGRLYEELIPIEQLSYKGYNTPELANAKIKQVLDEVKKEMPLFTEKWVNTEYDNPDWKATCEAMNERTLAREKWFIKWFGEQK